MGLVSGFLLVVVFSSAFNLPSRVQIGPLQSLLSALPLSQPASAQRFSIDQVWQQVYERLPDLPRENQYTNLETGEPALDNTLVGRFIRYHFYTKGRPPVYRLDWKLTMADYLGANQPVWPENYPSADTLSQNPMEGDVAAIRSLDRSQRDALIQAIVDIIAAEFASTPDSTPSSVDTPTASPGLNPDSPGAGSFPREPQPGDAQLLIP
ncbi:MAG: hypothetical protein Kow00121_43780 [Elainellaceae cyanobacterium]